MSVIVICGVAFLASGLTFFSGFGLGTLLLPAFALFYPVEQAVALTAIVHFLNGLFKLVLVGRHADRTVLVRFGLPAILAAFLGAWLLVRLASVGALFEYSVFGHPLRVMPASFAIGLLLLGFALMELLPTFRDYAFPRKYLSIGGFLTGFFGGLAGMQGALRSAFLAKSGLTKEGYIATGAVLASLIDISRLGVYGPSLLAQQGRLDYGVVGAAVLAAFAGAYLGNRYLRKITMTSIQRIVAILLFLIAIGLITGLV
jgi:uncharacterized protein